MHCEGVMDCPLHRLRLRKDGRGLTYWCEWAGTPAFLKQTHDACAEAFDLRRRGPGWGDHLGKPLLPLLCPVCDSRFDIWQKGVVVTTAEGSSGYSKQAYEAKGRNWDALINGHGCPVRNCPNATGELAVVE
jgi:hypothetical protein